MTSADEAAIRRIVKEAIKEALDQHVERFFGVQADSRENGVERWQRNRLFLEDMRDRKELMSKTVRERLIGLVLGSLIPTAIALYAWVKSGAKS